MTMLTCDQCSYNNSTTTLSCYRCKADLRAMRAEFFLGLAEAAFVQGKHDQAQAQLLAADAALLTLSAEQLASRMFVGRAYFLQGAVNYNKGLMDIARADLLLACAKLEGQPASASLHSRALNMLGNIVFLGGRIEGAEQYYRDSAALAEQADLSADAVVPLGNLAMVYSQTNQIEQAFATHTKALAYAERSGQPIKLAVTYCRLALLHAQYGPFWQAVSYADQMLALRSQVDDPTQRSQLVAGTSIVYSWGGRLADSETYIKEAYTLLSEGYHTIGEFVLVHMLSLAALYETTPKWLDQAIKQMILSTTEPNRVWELYVPMARYYLSSGDINHIRHHLQWIADKHKAGNPNADAVSQQGRALLLAALGDWQQASDLYAQIISNKVNRPRDQAVLLAEHSFMLARLNQQQPNPLLGIEAAASRRKAADLFEQIGLPRGLDQCNAWLERVYHAAGGLG